MHHLKRYSTTITYYDKIRSRPTPMYRLSHPPPVTLESRSPWLLGRCSRHLRKSLVGANVVYSPAESVFILGHYFALKSFAAGREAFSNAYSDKEVPNKTIHRPLKGHGKSVTSAHRATKQLNLRPYRFQAVHQFNNGIRLQEFNIATGFIVLCVKGFKCSG
jgi:hypothetical protein